MKLVCVVCIDICEIDCDQTALTLQEGTLYCRGHLYQRNNPNAEIRACMTPRSIQRQEREDAIRTTTE